VLKDYASSHPRSYRTYSYLSSDLENTTSHGNLLKEYLLSVTRNKSWNIAKLQNFHRGQYMEMYDFDIIFPALGRPLTRYLDSNIHLIV
jgi:hypothetical protein